MARKANLLNFLKKFKIKHPSLEYDNSNEFNWKKPLRIICPEHGEFKCLAQDLLKGSGCPKCAGRYRTTSDFIKEAQKIHSTRYDYSQTEYNKSTDKVKIICPKHGVFNQRAIYHLKGGGCPQCSGSKKTTKTFIEEAKKIHGDKYDYSKVDYKNLKSEIIIGCKIHGDFNQKPREHLNGCGCPKCGGTQKMTTLGFKEKAGIIHGAKYDYNPVDYKSSHQKIKILCPEHGIFNQKPNTHLNGAGCPNCSHTGFNPDMPAILYYLYDPQEDLYKIGITNKTIEERFGKSFCSNRAIAILEQTHFDNGLDAYLAEQEILEAFGYARCENPSWPETKGGRTEFFKEDILHKHKDDND